MALEGLLWCIAALLGAGIGGIVIGRHRAATVVVYAITLCITTIALLISGISLLIPDSPGTALTLPVGLPWLGAHFRLDALSAFFLVVINLGGGAASLFALGYGRHEEAPGRVLPFYPAFLAGMNLVLLAADAFTFLFAWEFMSLSSWALVMAHHRRPGKQSKGEQQGERSQACHEQVEVTGCRIAAAAVMGHDECQ